MILHVSSQAHLFPEAEHTFKRASDMMPMQSSQTVYRGMTRLDNYQLMVVILTKWGVGGCVCV
jgi:hypothetical protein